MTWTCTHSHSPLSSGPFGYERNRQRAGEGSERSLGDFPREPEGPKLQTDASRDTGRCYLRQSLAAGITHRNVKGASPAFSKLCSSSGGTYTKDPGPTLRSPLFCRTFPVPERT
jgi:hypothetical protein